MEKLTSLSDKGATRLRWTIAILMPFIIVWSFFVNESPLFQQPELARIMFWHVPCPMISSSMLLIGAWFSYRQLQTGDLKWDVRACACYEIGLLFGVLTMLAGMIFSKVQWGEWWQWDPRQTSYLLVLFLYGGYFLLRGAYRELPRRAAHAAGFGLAATLPMMFLTFVFPRLPVVAAMSFHPTNTIMDGQVHGSYGEVLTATILILTLLTAVIYRARAIAGLLELKSYEIGRLETDGGGAAPTRVVRPVRLPPAH